MSVLAVAPVPEGVTGLPLLATPFDEREAWEPRWKALRGAGIGASEAAAALGLDPWRSPLSLWLEKRGELPGWGGNERSYWGLALEEPIAQRFAEHTGLVVRRADVLLAHPDHPWMRATPDRWFFGHVGDPGVLELKCTDSRNEGEWEDDNVPDHYYIQVQWQLAVTGLRRAWIAVLIGGNTFRCVEIVRDDELIADLISAGQRFWESVVAGTEPPADGAASTTDALKERYPSAEEGRTIELGDELEGLLMRREVVRAGLDLAKAQSDEVDNRIRQLMGAAEIATVRGVPRCSWKSSIRRGFDGSRHKAEHPECHAECQKETNVRTLRALKPKEE